MLVLDGLTFAHEGQTGAYRFDMEVEQGAVTAVSGASGSGKSTLLDLIAGFLVPSAGSLTVGGEDLLPLPPEKRPVSILFQSETLFEHLSAEANVRLGLPAAARGRDAGRATAAALARVGIEGLGRQRASTLSGGQKQRVALARTLLRDKAVLLLDEPFSALDDESRGAVRGLVGRLTKERRWHTVLVSHSADDIAAIANRAYRLEAGRLHDVTEAR